MSQRSQDSHIAEYRSQNDRDRFLGDQSGLFARMLSEIIDLEVIMIAVPKHVMEAGNGLAPGGLPPLPNRFDPERASVLHVFCRRGDVAIDAEGKCSEEDMVQKWTFSGGTLGRDFLLYSFSPGDKSFDKFFPGDPEEALDYIKENWDLLK